MSKLTYNEILDRLINSNLSIEGFAFEEIPYKKPYSEKALEAQKTRDEWIKSNPHPGYNSPELSKWQEQSNLYPSSLNVASEEWLLENNIPKFYEIDQYGGEGKGDTWYSVKYFPDHDIYIRVDGFYSSYNGTDFYNGWDCCSEVRPQKKTITVYE